MSHSPKRFALVAAFGAVYLIWGSTYLGIRYAIESIPPLLMAGSRFAVAGVVLLLFDRLRGANWPDRREWANAAVTGILLLGVGNGGITWAEQTVPSGIAALVASAVPLWMTLMDWLRPGGNRPTVPTVGGLVLGTAGLLVLIGAGPGGAEAIIGSSELGMAVLFVATFGWALGSVVASHVRFEGSPITAIGAQMTIGGAALLVAGLLAGEAAAFDPVAITTRSMMAWAYLVVFGSWVGFTAYVWLLRNTSPAMASTHAFVNPVVAVILGVWIASEPLDARTGIAIAVILGGVALIVLNRGRGGGSSGLDTRNRRSRIVPAAPAPIRRYSTEGETA